MTIRHLDHLFRPRSAAVVGTPNRAGSLGQTVFANLLTGGFEGPILLVGEVFSDNNAVLGLTREFGFTTASAAKYDAIRVTLSL